MELKRTMKSFEELNLRIQQLASVQGKVGWFEGSNYPDGTPVAEIAAQNEFGNASKKIPPRPTMRPAIIENENKWRDLAAQGARSVIAGKSTPKDVMEKLTLDAESAVSKNIATLTSPKLAPYTIQQRQAKGNTSTKPLVDTGLEFATLTSVVENANS